MTNRLLLILLVLAAIVLPFLGFAAGMPIGRAWNSGSFERWQRLPDPPARPVEIVTGSTGEVYIRTEDGGIYSCRPGESECWIESEEPEALPTESEWCDDYPIRYAVRRPPRAVVDSLQVQWCHFEAGEEVDYAILEDGKVWMWHHFDANFLNMARVLLPMGAGCLTGLIASTALLIYVWRKRRAARTAEQSITGQQGA